VIDCQHTNILGVNTMLLLLDNGLWHFDFQLNVCHQTVAFSESFTIIFWNQPFGITKLL